ncbi:MAG: hypothetical protein VKJ04_10540 [Vampirovibrionales bacterium]|nr:hypothetical protein [Vampirovibrionales bacterium]
MEKTYLRFVCVEVMERMARCDALLAKLATTAAHGNRHVLDVIQGLQARLAVLEGKLIEERELLSALLSDTGNAPAQDRQALMRLLSLSYQALCQITQVLTPLEASQMVSSRTNEGDIQPEIYFFLKDALPEAIQPEDSICTVVVGSEGKTAQAQIEETLCALQLQQVQFAWLSILQQDNPLAWVSLSEPALKGLAGQAIQKADKALASVLKQITQELEKDAGRAGLETATILQHALGLRIFGPAYYFQLTAQSLLSYESIEHGGERVAKRTGGQLSPEAFAIVENALFYGLNHFNVAHNQTVILHEAGERLLKEQNAKTTMLSQSLLADLFKASEKLIQERFAFNAKHLERAIQLKERLAEGILLSSASVFPMSEVAQAFDKAAKEQRGQGESEEAAEGSFPIYPLLSMTTEYPHTPREIINAGWLHKVERGGVWAFAALQEETSQGLGGQKLSAAAPQVAYQKLAGLFSAQDHLLAKSIETAELHRVLLCTPEPARA